MNRALVVYNTRGIYLVVTYLTKYFNRFGVCYCVLLKDPEEELVGDLVFGELALLQVTIARPDCLSEIDDRLIEFSELSFGVMNWDNTQRISLPCNLSFSSHDDLQ